jgi:hypothetical protein
LFRACPPLNDTISIHALQLKGDELLCHFPAFLGVAK